MIVTSSSSDASSNAVRKKRMRCTLLSKYTASDAKSALHSQVLPFLSSSSHCRQVLARFTKLEIPHSRKTSGYQPWQNLVHAQSISKEAKLNPQPGLTSLCALATAHVQHTAPSIRKTLLSIDHCLWPTPSTQMGVSCRRGVQGQWRGLGAREEPHNFTPATARAS